VPTLVENRPTTPKAQFLSIGRALVALPRGQGAHVAPCQNQTPTQPRSTQKPGRYTDCDPPFSCYCVDMISRVFEVKGGSWPRLTTSRFFISRKVIRVAICKCNYLIFRRVNNDDEARRIAYAPQKSMCVCRLVMTGGGQRKGKTLQRNLMDGQPTDRTDSEPTTAESQND